MKMLVVLFCLLLVGVGYSQNPLAPSSNGYDPKKIGNESSNYTNLSRNNTAQVIQSTGKRFNTEEINGLARRDINGIASTVAGVDSRPGTNEIPSIRGAAPSGTAYFVDGVRVYGALPVISK